MGKPDRGRKTVPRGQIIKTRIPFSGLCRHGIFSSIVRDNNGLVIGKGNLLLFFFLWSCFAVPSFGNTISPLAPGHVRSCFSVLQHHFPTSVNHGNFCSWLSFLFFCFLLCIQVASMLISSHVVGFRLERPVLGLGWIYFLVGFSGFLVVRIDHLHLWLGPFK